MLLRIAIFGITKETTSEINVFFFLGSANPPGCLFVDNSGWRHLLV